MEASMQDIVFVHCTAGIVRVSLGSVRKLCSNITGCLAQLLCGICWIYKFKDEKVPRPWPPWPLCFLRPCLTAFSLEQRASATSKVASLLFSVHWRRKRGEVDTYRPRQKGRKLPTTFSLEQRAPTASKVAN